MCEIMEEYHCHYCGFDIFNYDWQYVAGMWFCTAQCQQEYSGSDEETNHDHN